MNGVRGDRGTHNKRLGRKGERAARRFLKRNGWKIVAKNYRNPFGEVDIIAEKRDICAFIEVKTRTGDEFGEPSEAVNAARRKRYILAAKYYFSGREPEKCVRFDVIEVFRGSINHIENAFY